MKYVKLFLLAAIASSCATSTSAGCAAYAANRPSVGDGDTAETMRSVLKLDVAMDSACRFK